MNSLLVEFAALLGGSGSGGTLLLETLPNAGLAFSVRKIRGAYSGSCMRVRRSTDNAEMDVGFTSDGNLDTTAMLSWGGSASIFVKTWYNQAPGTGIDATQATAASQPRIVNAGTLETQNGRPAPRFDGTDDFLANTGFVTSVFSINRIVTAAAVVRSLRTSQTSEGILDSWRNSTMFDHEAGFILERRTTNINANLGVGSSGNYIGYQTADSNTSALSMIHYIVNAPATTAQSMYIDKTSKSLSVTYSNGSGSIANFQSAGLANMAFALGGRSGDSAHTTWNSFFQGHICELIVWPDNQTANRSVMETSQGVYFGTP